MQRMGRLNRRLENPDGPCCLVYDYDGMDGRPYRRADLKAARDVVRKLAEERRVLSQRDLKNALDGMPEEVDDIRFHSAWLDGGWESKQATLREGDATVPFCWSNTRATSASGSRKSAKVRPSKNGWCRSCTTRKESTSFAGINGYSLVSDVEYDEEKGAR